MYMKYWVASPGKAGEIYSLDKLVVVFHLRGLSRERNGGQRLLDELAGRLLLQYDHWQSWKIGQYRDQFSIKCPGNESFFLGIGLNTGGLPNQTARVEFNPNKVGGTWELAVVYNACWDISGGQLTIKQYDLAIDYPVPREDLNLLKDNRLYEERRRSDSDRTQYIGQRNQPGRCKLYNKQLEQGLDKPLTRLEMTVAFEDSCPSRVAELMPPVVSVSGAVQTELELPRLTDTDLFILTTLSREPERVAELGRRKREALRPWLDVVNQPLRFDMDAYGPIFQALMSWLGRVPDAPRTPFDDVFTEVLREPKNAPDGWAWRESSGKRDLTENGQTTGGSDDEESR